MKRDIITTVLLAIGIVFITLGIHNSDLIPSIIGGFCIGVYNSIINAKIEE